MTKVLEYKASDKSKGMTAQEIRAALDDAERSGAIVTIASRTSLGGKIHSLTIQTTLGGTTDAA